MNTTINSRPRSVADGRGGWVISNDHGLNPHCQELTNDGACGLPVEAGSEFCIDHSMKRMEAAEYARRGWEY